ncbi:MAG: tRNA1(Val) (adenine(37)-N6)-methyltransferase [Thermodesulfobacteriota bacterium]
MTGKTLRNNCSNESVHREGDETIEPIGRFRLIQGRRGYRYSVDSLCLSRFVLPVRRGDRIIDIGTGSGVIPLLLMESDDGQRITGVEVQDELFSLAGRNIALNNLTGRVELIHTDYRDLRKLRRRGSFDLIVSNPPYVKEGCGRVSSIEERAIARMEHLGSLSELVEISSYLLSKGGRACYIYPVSRLQELLSALQAKGLYATRLLFIHPKEATPATLFTIEATDSRGETVIEAPLFLDGTHPGNLT